MTVATTASAKTYTGNGASTTWDTDFPVPSADALVVTLTTIATGSEAVLDPSEYSATGFGYTGVVTVTYPTSGSPLASTHKITLERDLAYTQGTDLENQDGFYPNVVENALDYATMLIQQVRNSALRTIQFPVSDGTGLTATLPPASERANKVLIFDTSGNVDVEDFTSGSVGLDTATFDQDATGYFWADAGARIHRMNDRLMLGDATVNDGEAVPTVKDWLETIRDNTTKNSQLAVLSSIGQTAILGGSRSSDFPSAGSMGCIGVQGWAINDNVTDVQSVYAAYFEARQTSGAGTTHGLETNVVAADEVDINPYAMTTSGLTAGLWVASGGEIAAADASVALGIINNGAAFKKGIVFQATALEGSDGVTGSGVAMQVAKGHNIQQRFTGDGLGAAIIFDISNLAAQQKLLFSDVGTLFRNGNDKAMLSVGINSTYVNGVAITPSNTGVTVQLRAAGDDTNIDLRIGGKGSGMLDLATGTTTTATAGTRTLPAQPATFASVKVFGTEFRIPLYNP